MSRQTGSDWTETRDKRFLREKADLEKIKIEKDIPIPPPKEHHPWRLMVRKMKKGNSIVITGDQTKRFRSAAITEKKSIVSRNIGLDQYRVWVT